MATMMSIDEHQSRKARSQKLLLWFAMASMTMMFAAAVSAYIVSRPREDWKTNYEMPISFYLSSLIIVLCSLTIHLAKSYVKKNKRTESLILLFLTLFLSLLFCFFQVKGYYSFVDQNLYLVNDISISFFCFIAGVHLLHILGGIISLLIIIYNHFKQKYNSTQFLGIELGAMYWHFLDFLWICLFLFLYFFK